MLHSSKHTSIFHIPSRKNVNENGLRNSIRGRNEMLSINFVISRVYPTVLICNYNRKKTRKFIIINDKFKNEIFRKIKDEMNKVNVVCFIYAL